MKSESTATPKNKSHDSPLRELTVFYASMNACFSTSHSVIMMLSNWVVPGGSEEMNHNVSLKLKYIIRAINHLQLRYTSSCVTPVAMMTLVRVPLECRSAMISLYGDWNGIGGPCTTLHASHSVTLLHSLSIPIKWNVAVNSVRQMKPWSIICFIWGWLYRNAIWFRDHWCCLCHCGNMLHTYKVGVYDEI